MMKGVHFGLLVYIYVKSISFRMVFFFNILLSFTFHLKAKNCNCRIMSEESINDQSRYDIQ